MINKEFCLVYKVGFESRESRVKDVLNKVFPSESMNRFQEVHELIQKHGFDTISRESSRRFINFLGKTKQNQEKEKNPTKKI